MMGRPSSNHLSKNNMTVTELKAGIAEILDGGDEYTAREISEILRRAGKDVNIHRVANTIRDMLGIDRRQVHSPTKGCRMYYAYRKQNLLYPNT